METDNETETFTQDQPLIPEHSKQAAKALAFLLFYSFLMFTLPLAAFYGSKYVLEDYFNITGFPNTAWSVLVAVVTVNLIIVGYVYHAYHEKEYNEHGEELDENGITKGEKQE